MAKRDKSADAENTNEETGTPEQRRRQSQQTRLKFALNNLLNAAEQAGLEAPEVDAANRLLVDLEFARRESTVVTAERIEDAIKALDFMDDLTPQRMKKLGQLLGRAQRGDTITEQDIEDITGLQFVDADGEEEAEVVTEEAVEEPEA